MNSDQVGEAGAAAGGGPGPRAYLPGRLGFASQADIDEFVATLARFEAGELDGEAWRKFRLVRGVYGQRQPGLQMLRVKIPQGVLTSAQLRTLARVVQRYGDGRAHVTTRQNVQLYALPMGEVEAAMRELAGAGLTTREACGHSVRSITACALAGVSTDEIFDVTPYADALTRYLLRGPRSSSLPRKFKIAMEGCRRGCVAAPINDLAFVARIAADGRRGFLVLCGGGTATLSRSGQVLVPFLPAGELFELADAVIAVFHREGERQNKHKARLKWLIQKLGFAEFSARVSAERATLRAEPAEARAARALPFDGDAPPAQPLPEGAGPAGAGPVLPLVLDEPGYPAWHKSNVAAQRQAGYVTVQVTLPLGDLLPAQLEGLAQLAEQHADGQVRTTTEQNLVLRFVTAGRTRELYRQLRALGLSRDGAGWLGDVTSCPGADTCALAVTASRGMARSLGEHLQARRALPDGDAAALRDGTGLDGAHIRISGCPNGCGQHHIADVGLQGGLRKLGGRALPVYHLTIGGSTGGDAEVPAARFGRLVGKLPVRRGAQAIDRVLALWRRQRQADEPLAAFLGRVSVDAVRAELADLFEIGEATAAADDFVDLGQQAPFTVAAGEGECAA